MNYLIPILLLSVFLILVSNINNSYAVGTLSFSQDASMIDHSIVIYCTDCTDEPDPMQVTLKNNDINPKMFNLYKIAGTNNYSSLFIQLCSGNCANDYPNTTQTNLSVSKNGYATKVIPIGTDENLVTLGNYNVNAALISPWKSVCDSFPGAGGDSDTDGICNNWENGVNNSLFPNVCTGPGLCITTATNSKIYYLPCDPNSSHWSNMCPNKDKPDVYFEIDYMQGHKPSDAAISAVATVFQNAGYIQNSIGGINFHAQLDEGVLPHIPAINWQGSSNSPGFNQLKYWWFGTASERGYSWPSLVPGTDWWNNGQYGGSKRSEKAQVFHYIVFGHTLSAAGTESNGSGGAETPGNDAIVTTGGFTGMVGSEQEQQSILLHEIGHTLKLNHGGTDSTNCKPNYLSVMNYAFQFPNPVIDRRLDFSRLALNQLDESNLNEFDGVFQSYPSGQTTAYGPPPVLTALTGTSIDWDRNGTITNPAATTDINNFGISGCDGYGSVLKPFRDWHVTAMKLSPLDNPTSSAHDASLNPTPEHSTENDEVINPDIDEVPSNPGNDTEGGSGVLDLPVSEVTPNLDNETDTEVGTLDLPASEDLEEEIVLNLDVLDPNTGEKIAEKDGMGGNVILEMITYEDQVLIHIQKLDSILNDIESIPNENFNPNPRNSKDLLKKDIEEVKTLVRASIGGHNTMVDAYKKLDDIYLKLDGTGRDEVLVSNSPFLKPLKEKVTNEIISQSYSLGEAGDFLNKGRDQNMRPTIIPKPNEPEKYEKPYKMYKQVVRENDISNFVCNYGLEPVIRIKGDNSNQPLCVFPKHKQLLIEREFAIEYNEKILKTNQSQN